MFLQPGVFNFPFQRAGVLNCTLWHVTRWFIFICSSPPLCWEQQRTSSSQPWPEIALITQLKNSKGFLYCLACLELPEISLFSWGHFFCSVLLLGHSPSSLPLSTEKHSQEQTGWDHGGVFGAICNARFIPVVEVSLHPWRQCLLLILPGSLLSAFKKETAVVGARQPSQPH